MSGNGPGPCWWVCKYCKRAFPRSEELVAHKKGTHRLQFLKDKNAKKLKKSTKLCQTSTSGTDEHSSVASASSNQGTDQISDSGTTEAEILTNIVTVSAPKTLLNNEESISLNSSKILVPVVTPLTISEPDPPISTSENSNTTGSSFGVPAIEETVITNVVLLEAPLESQETELESLTNDVVTEASLSHAESESTSALSSTRRLIPVITPLPESEPSPSIPSTSRRRIEVRATKKIVVTSSVPLIPLKSIITSSGKKDSEEIRAESSTSSTVTSTTTAKRVKFNLPEDYRGSSSSSEDDVVRVITTRKSQNENNEKPESSSMLIPTTSKSRPSLKRSKNENPSISASPKRAVSRRGRMKRKIRFTFRRKLTNKCKVITSNSKRNQINLRPKRKSVTESVPEQKSLNSKKSKRSRSQFKCSHCNKICKSHHVLVEHERIHTGEKPHVCSTCKVAFGFKTSYNRHCLRPHKFHCSRCPLKFTMENHLKKHKVFHEGRQKIKNQPSRHSLQNLSSISSPVVMEEKVIPVASVKPFLPGPGGPSSTKPLELIQKFESSNSNNSSSSSDCLRNPKIPIQTPLISRLRLKLQKKRTFSYRCRTCYKIFDKPKERMHHEENTHGGIPAQNKCRFCGKILRLNYQLITHERMHTGERPYNCAYCERTFSLSSNQLTHMKNIHSAQFAADSKILRNHSRATTPSSSPRTKTRRSSSTGRASRQFHQSSKYPAPMPTRSSSSSSRSPSPRKVQQQQQQQRVKVSSNSNSDSDSDLEVKPKPELMGNSDSNSKYFCKKCKIGFLSDKLLIAHKLMHTYDNRYNCPYCPKAFKSSGILIAHKRTHTGERPFPCQFCELKFRHLQNVKRHEQTIHKYARQGQGQEDGVDKNKVGNVNGNPNSSKAQFKIRLLKVNNSWNHFVSSLKKRSRMSVRRSRTITKLKTRSASVNKDDDSQDKPLKVGAGTSRQDSDPSSSPSSVSHARNEAGNFECQYCSKEFNGRSNLVVHERIHSGEKPHVCPYTDCRKGFTQSHSLKEHIRTHTGERPCVCPECGRCFVAHSALQAHLKNVHLVKNLTRKYRQQNQVRRASKHAIPKILEIKAKSSTSASPCSLALNSKDLSAPVDSVDVIATVSKNTPSEVTRIVETTLNSKPQPVVHIPVSVSARVQIQVPTPTPPLPLATAGLGHKPEEISKQIPSQKITTIPLPSLSHSVADKAVVVINNRNINFNLKSGTPTTVAAAALGPSTSVSMSMLTSAASSKTTKIQSQSPAPPVKTSTKSIGGFSILKRKKKNHGLKNNINAQSNSKSSSSSSNNGLPSCIQQKLNLHVLQYVCITCDRRFSYRIDAVRHAASAHPSSTYILEVKWTLEHQYTSCD